MSHILEEYFSCPICIDVLKNPITIVCGHSFCEKCLIRSLTSCPLCKAKFSPYEKRINIQMSKIIQDLRNLKLEEIKDKFFPYLKNEKNIQKKDLKLLINKTFGKDFLCEYDFCYDYIKLLTFDYLLYPNEFLKRFKEGKIYNKLNLFEYFITLI
jgi:hypothetical protein